jgi:hypothetical protein
MSVITKQKMTWEPFYKLNRKHSDKFFIKDCIPDGNCQFRAVSEALKGGESRFNHKKLRKLIAEYIIDLPDSEFKDIVNNYRIEKMHHEFVGNWDPFKVKTQTQLARHIKKSGFHFQGDDFTLSLMSKRLDVDFIIFGNNSITELSHIHPKIIMLYYTGDHYKTIGIKRKGSRKIITLIDRHDLQNTVRGLIDKYYFLENEISTYYSKCKTERCPFTLTTLYKHLENQTKAFSISKRDITELINSLIKKMSVSKGTSMAKDTKERSIGFTDTKEASMTSKDDDHEEKKMSKPLTLQRRIRKTTHK